ncbi:MAG: acylphosphatase [Halanaerobium sp.]
MKIKGEHEKIKEMLKKIKEGPSFARVDDIQIIDEELENFDRFEIRF